MNMSMNLSRRHRIRIEGEYTVRVSVPRLRTACLVVVLLAAGCSSEGEAPATPSAPATSQASSPSSSATPSTAADGARTAMDAYRGMWKAYVEAIRVPDPKYPGLARYSQGDALDVWVTGLTSVAEQGLVGEGEVTLKPAVRSANPNATPPTVEIRDCVDSSKSRLVKQDGSPYQDTPGGKRATTATVARISEGVWKVTQIAIDGVGTC
ncbi:hypothetical protein [Micromonospora sp. WMMD1082]|uniref:hypothetical protein n=1 Tax=Micromonospora sp. WMMD1082 TaxID=3016104 RepID=UPI002417BDDC|nr:hypothetical protein [Micromonospora sp. WMMD1082]MDG4795442.1 hypothetical protein [Micromonospora sp. WMMD1082]